MQGFNMGRYRPPESLDSSLAPVSKRARTTKSWQTPAQPTIRFEMPFAIWCQTCPDHAPSRLIGQGVRFNARKTRVGAYHSTPIWAFELKHAACGGRIEIRTDPENHDFVVTEGARKRDTGDDAAVAERTGGTLVEGGGMVQSREAEERAAARQDAFVAFEGKKLDKEKGENMAKRLEALKSVKERDWRDPDEANRRLRQNFRSVRRDRDRDRERGEALADAMGFGFDLLEGSEADLSRARLIEFGAVPEFENRAETKPLFAKEKKKSHVQREDLQTELFSNTRAVMNPFAQEHPATGSEGRQSMILQQLRKKVAVASAVKDAQVNQPEAADAILIAKEDASTAPVHALVAYDSD